MSVHKQSKQFAAEKIIKKKSFKDFSVERSIINALTDQFENWNEYLEKNTFYQEPTRRGNFGEISELNFRLEDNTRKKVSYFGTLSNLDYLLCTK